MRKNKKIYPFIIAATIMVSFIVNNDINDNKGSYAFAETLLDISTGDATHYGPMLSVEYLTEKESVEHDTQTVYNDKEFEGYQKVIQEGSDGVREYVYEELHVNGNVISRSLEEEKLAKEPVTEIVEIGTKKPLTTSLGGLKYSQELTMSATAYDLSYESTGKYPGHPSYGVTASGTKAQPGTVAVDPRVIPLGTKLYIASLDGTPDYGFATAEDTGGAIKGNKIDLFMENSTDVYNFGRRQVKVYILE